MRLVALLLAFGALALPARGQGVVGRWRDGDLVVDLAAEPAAAPPALGGTLWREHTGCDFAFTREDDGAWRGLLELGARPTWVEVTLRADGALRWEHREWTGAERVPHVFVLRRVPALPIEGGVTDAAGAPIAGARVALWRGTFAPRPKVDERGELTPAPVTSATTDARGRYRLEVFDRDDRYTIAAAAPGRALQARRIQGAPLAARRLELRPFALRVQRPLLVRLSQKSATVRVEGPRRASCRVEGDRWLIPDLPPGEYRVTAWSDDRYVEGSVTLPAVGGAELRLDLLPCALREVRVLDLGGPTSGWTADDTRFEAGLIRVRRPAGEFPLEVTTTRERREGTTRRTTFTRTVTLPAEEPATVVLRDEVATISGEVTSTQDGKRPLPHSVMGGHRLVEFVSSDGRVAASTELGPSGRFELVVPAGVEGALRVEPLRGLWHCGTGGLTPMVAPIRRRAVRAGDAGLRLELPHAALEGSVVDATGVGVPDALVRIRLPGDEAVEVETNMEGEFSVWNAFAGAATLEVVEPWGRGAARVELVDGEVTPVRLTVR